MLSSTSSRVLCFGLVTFAGEPRHQEITPAIRHLEHRLDDVIEDELDTAA